MFSSTFVVAFAAFVVVSGLVGLVALRIKASEGGRAEGRLDQLVGRGGRRDSSADMLLKQALQDVDKKTIIDAIMPAMQSYSRYFEQADVTIKPGTLLAMSLLAAMGGGFISAVLAQTVYVAPVGGIIGLACPWIWLWWKRKSRLANFAYQLPDAMELTARALRAGHSLAAGLHVVAEEMPPPISKEFGRVYDEQNMGIPLEEALRSLAERVPNLDLKFFCTAVQIQRQTGGDLAEILDKIGYVVRERYKILGQVKALTGEGRLSGIVLILLPFAMFVFMLHTKYDYIQMLWTDDLGIKMSIGALILQVAGAICIKKIVDIKV
ncbi:MAG: type II secretion system F family protein [Gemmataceae bacterium]|nr:type II secretion system F family protein [Gemmataceae bacterium]